MKLTKPIDQALYFFAVLTGLYGQGKSTLAHTAPGPILSLDAEGRTRFLENHHIITFEEWQESPKQKLGHESIVVLPVRSYADYRKGIDLVTRGDHPFRSLVIDSLPEIQEKMKAALRPGVTFENYSRADWDVWDRLQHFMMEDMRYFQDLSLPEHRRPMNVVVVCPINEDEDTPRRPYVQGKLRKHVMGFPDMQIAVKRVKELDDETGTTRPAWVLILNDDEEMRLKCNIPGIVSHHEGDEVWDPDLTEDIAKVINHQETKETA